MKFHVYEPELKANITLGAAVGIGAVGTAVLWYYHKELELTLADMIMLTGIALTAVLLGIKGYIKKKENFEETAELKKQRDEMDPHDFSDTGFFFGEKKPHESVNRRQPEKEVMSHSPDNGNNRP